jgi:hypothetical protein
MPFNLMSYHSDHHSDEELLDFKNQVKKAVSRNASFGEEDVAAYLAVVDALKLKPTL